MMSPSLRYGLGCIGDGEEKWKESRIDLRTPWTERARICFRKKQANAWCFTRQMPRVLFDGNAATISEECFEYLDVLLSPGYVPNCSLFWKNSFWQTVG
jgi:hypothetical protein